MTTYSAYVSVTKTYKVKVEANNPEEAANKATDMDYKDSKEVEEAIDVDVHLENNE